MDVQGPAGATSPAPAALLPHRGADFDSASSACSSETRAARRTAMQLTPEGVLDLKGVTFTTCPVERKSWQLKAKEHHPRHAHHGSAPGATPASNFEGVPHPLSAVAVLPAEQRPQERLPVPEHRQHLHAAACSCGAVLLEHRAERRLHLRAHRVHHSAASTSAATALPQRQPARRAQLELPALRQRCSRQAAAACSLQATSPSCRRSSA